MPTTARFVDSDQVTELIRLGITSGDPYVLNRLDFGFPEVRAANSVGASSADGEIDRVRYHGARIVTTEITLRNYSQIGPSMDWIRGMAHPSRRIWLYVNRSDWPAGERRILVRGESVTPSADPAVLSATWRAPKGVMEAATPTSVTLVPIGGAESGISTPLTTPFSFQPGLVPGASIIAVAGTVPTPPIIDIYGPCSSPLIRCIDINAQISFPGLNIAAGDYLHVDVDAHTAFINNDPTLSRYNFFDFSTSTWWRLPADPSVQIVFTPANPSTGCQAVVSWRPRWI